VVVFGIQKEALFMSLQEVKLPALPGGAVSDSPPPHPALSRGGEGFLRGRGILACFGKRPTIRGGITGKISDSLSGYSSRAFS
jgi:hypothetical protein